MSVKQAVPKTKIKATKKTSAKKTLKKAAPKAKNWKIWGRLSRTKSNQKEIS